MKIAALDVETLSLDKNTAIVSDIGIVVLDDYLGVEDVLGLRPNLIEQLLLGRTCSSKTVDFYTDIFGGVKNFEKHLHNSEFYKNVSILDSHKQIAKILFEVDTIWINGLSFDTSVLESLYKLVGKNLPWEYRKEIDVRTINNLVNPTLQKAIKCKQEAELVLTTDKTKISKHDAIAEARWNLVIAGEFFNNIKDFYIRP